MVWLLLLTMPFWLPAVGGYVELGSRVVVLGLAAMALNFLLGYTGVLSFGHAAYFGLGAYGAGMTIRYLVPSTGARHPGRHAGRHARGGAHRPADHALARRLFRHGDDRLRPGVLFHRLPLELGDRRRRRPDRLDAQPLDFGFATIDILHDPVAFYYFVLVVFAIAAGIMAWLLRSPFGRTLIAIRENERRARFLGIPVDSTSGCPG